MGGMQKLEKGQPAVVSLVTAHTQHEIGVEHIVPHPEKSQDPQNVNDKSRHLEVRDPDDEKDQQGQAAGLGKGLEVDFPVPSLFWKLRRVLV